MCSYTSADTGRFSAGQQPVEIDLHTKRELYAGTQKLLPPKKDKEF